MCARCASQRGQYFRRSTRSGCFRLFLSVKKLRLLHSVHSNVILSLGTTQSLDGKTEGREDGRTIERGGERPLPSFRPSVRPSYFRILVTTPAPTVRPPSRMANRSPSSIAIGVISSIVIWMLSPGITISTPAGSSTDPVTSVVRK